MNQLRDILPLSVGHNANRTALIDSGQQHLSYTDLSLRVDALQKLLVQRAVGAGDAVGIYLPKCTDSVASILATLATGAAYIPIDAHSPVARVSFILADSLARAVFVDSTLADQLTDQLPCRCDVWNLEQFEMTLLICEWDDSSASEFSDDLAMILYTSGSTGVPKGVQITNLNAMTFVMWGVDTFSVSPDDICASIAPFHFDLSVFDLFVSLFRGAAIVLLDQKTVQNTLLLSSSLAKHQVSICYTTPTVLKMLLNFGRLDRYDHSSIRQVLFAGEVFPVRPLTQLRDRWGQASFYNLYGPTETNVITYHPIPAMDSSPRDRPYPIGLPCEHAICRILRDGEMHNIERGLQGELVVAGDTVTPGYFRDEERNRQVFIRDEKGRQFYKTGDFVQVNSDGDLEFLMREDRMVKRRGYRIELDEIEFALNAHDGLSEVAVIAVSENDETRIIVYFCPRPRPVSVSGVDLKQHCQERLPAYFMPDRFVDLEALPKTSSGKIDYRALEGMVR